MHPRRRHDNGAATPTPTAPSGARSAPSGTRTAAAPARAPVAGRSADRTEEGSLVAEYGLLTIVGATIAGLALKWAAGGAIFDLFSSILVKARALVGV